MTGTKRDNRAVGKRFENLAADYIESHGATILKQNYRLRDSEIDIIALDGEALCFVEVKYRKNTAFGYPCEAVDKAKQRKIILASEKYLLDNDLCGSRIRYDVVEIIGNNIRYMKNCFGGM